jgi:hypothetical protein
MFLKCSTRKKDGKEHRSWSIVESRRLGHAVVQGHVLYLGEINDSQRAAWQKSIAVFDEQQGQSHQCALFPEDRTPDASDTPAVQVRLNQLQLSRPRTWGDCWLGDQLWRELQLDTFFAPRLGGSREGTDWEKVLRLLTLYRLLSPGSEWRLHRHWFGTTALADLLGVDERHAQDDTLYRGLDGLLEHKDALFTHLRQRWSDLFGAKFDVLLYDLTSTYFECDVPGDEADPRRFGYSRDKRSDCVQVIVALVVTPEGLPLAYEMLPGNTADKTTLRDMLQRIQKRYGSAERIWVMDRGIPTEAVLTELRQSEAKVSYLVGTPKGQLTKLEKQLAEKPWQEVRPQLRVKLLPQDGEVYVLAESGARTDKERAIRRRKLKIYWQRLHELQRQELSRDQLLEKLGAARDRAGRVVAGLVKITVSAEGQTHLHPRPRPTAHRAPTRRPVSVAHQPERRKPRTTVALLHAVGVCGGSLPHLERRPGPAAHLPSQTRADRGTPLRGIPGILPEHHVTTTTQGAGGRSDAARGLRETGHAATAGRARAHNRRTGTAPGAPHRTGSGRGTAAGTTESATAAATAPAHQPAQSQLSPSRCSGDLSP